MYYLANNAKIYDSAAGINLTPAVTSILIGGGSATALVLPDGNEMGELFIATAITAYAHTITNTTGFNAGSTASDVATFGGEIGDTLMCEWTGSAWNILNARNVAIEAAIELIPTQELTASGAITIPSGNVFLNLAGVIAATLAAPAKDGQILRIYSKTAQAHTITQTTPGFNGLGTSGDLATFGGAISDGITVASDGGAWWIINNVNITLS